MLHHTFTKVSACAHVSALILNPGLGIPSYRLVMILCSIVCVWVLLFLNPGLGVLVIDGLGSCLVLAQ